MKCALIFVTNLDVIFLKVTLFRLPVTNKSIDLEGKKSYTEQAREYAKDRENV